MDRVGKYYADYSGLTPDEIAASDPKLDALFAQSKPKMSQPKPKPAESTQDVPSVEFMLCQYGFNGICRFPDCIASESCLIEQKRRAGESR